MFIFLYVLHVSGFFKKQVPKTKTKQQKKTRSYFDFGNTNSARIYSNFANPLPYDKNS